MGGTRFYDFVTGIESGPSPAATPPVGNDDIVTLGSIWQEKGSEAAPTVITAAGGITPIAGCRIQTHYVNCASAVILTANPQIAASDIDGTEITLIYIGTGSLEIDNGNGIDSDGPAVLTDGKSITYKYRSTSGKWSEKGRRADV